MQVLNLGDLTCEKKILISIPAYNEANNIRPLYKKLNETLEKKKRS